MRLAVYSDFSYRVRDGRLSGELPFSLFLQALSSQFELLKVVGRHDHRPGDFPYLLGGVTFAPLPYYSSGADPLALLRSAPRATIRFWRALEDVDAAWVLGPTPFALLFAVVTLLRRRRLILGMRQDLPRLFRARYPDRRLLRWGAYALEAAFRLLAVWCPLVVVGPDLARRHRRAARLHMLVVSLLHQRELMAADDDPRRYDDDELRILSVGRLDPEKNTLMLADVLAGVLAVDPRWRLDVCGNGPLAAALADRLDELGVAHRATLHGHVPIDDGLLDLYRSAHVLVHVSLSEGLPQVLLEAFATRLPVVATAVGGVPAFAGDCAVLIPPGDAEATVDALQRVATEDDRRQALVHAASQTARRHSLEAECERLARFITEAVAQA